MIIAFLNLYEQSTVLYVESNDEIKFAETFMSQKMKNVSIQKVDMKKNNRQMH